jgi:catechol 2,3-dioxygenase-like lactoylglutathione lyase family enzyme
VISAAHVILYSQDADADRAFLKDVLGFPDVDAGGGWLIFALPPAELAVHPTDGSPQHELFLICDDLDATMQTLADQGVQLSQPPTEQRWGKSTAVRLPGGGEIGLYQPYHAVAAGRA